MIALGSRLDLARRRAATEIWREKLGGGQVSLREHGAHDHRGGGGARPKHHYATGARSLWQPARSDSATALNDKDHTRDKHCARKKTQEFDHIREVFQRLKQPSTEEERTANLAYIERAVSSGSRALKSKVETPKPPALTIEPVEYMMQFVVLPLLI